MCAQSPRVCSYLQLIFLPFWEAISRRLILCSKTTSSPPLLQWNRSLPRFICGEWFFPNTAAAIVWFLLSTPALYGTSTNVKCSLQSCEKHGDSEEQLTNQSESTADWGLWVEENLPHDRDRLTLPAMHPSRNVPVPETEFLKRGTRTAPWMWHTWKSCRFVPPSCCFPSGCQLLLPFGRELRTGLPAEPCAAAAERLCDRLLTTLTVVAQ